jgi:hypothetical protein
LRIRVLIPLWKRPEVTKFCFKGLQRLIAESTHQIDVLCVISESEYIPICEDFGFAWTYHDNDPLGKKINAGVKRALEFEWDYLMMMNSDDIIKAELLDKYYKPFFENLTPFFGINRVTYVKFGTTEARDIEYGYSILGIGKCMRRDVVDIAIKRLGELYRSELSKCLDDTMLDNLMKLKVYPTIVKYDGMLAMDFKSETNIWPWERFENRGKKVCYNLGYEQESLIEK